MEGGYAYKAMAASTESPISLGPVRLQVLGKTLPFTGEVSLSPQASAALSSIGLFTTLSSYFQGLIVD